MAYLEQEKIKLRTMEGGDRLSQVSDMAIATANLALIVAEVKGLLTCAEDTLGLWVTQLNGWPLCVLGARENHEGKKVLVGARIEAKDKFDGFFLVEQDLDLPGRGKAGLRVRIDLSVKPEITIGLNFNDGEGILEFEIEDPSVDQFRGTMYWMKNWFSHDLAKRVLEAKDWRGLDGPKVWVVFVESLCLSDLLT